MSEPNTPTGKDALIIIPTYNEKENLVALVQEIHTVVPDVQLLIVDDNSPDGTGAMADRLSKDDERIHVEHRTGKLGLGTAYIHGFKWALARDYQFVFEMDADFSHQPRFLPDFLRAAQDHDLVLGSRYIPGGGTEHWSWSRKMISQGGNMYARLILWLPYKDGRPKDEHKIARNGHCIQVLAGQRRERRKGGTHATHGQTQCSHTPNLPIGRAGHIRPLHAQRIA